MQPPQDPSRIADQLPEIPGLAKLYDEFANALDPFSAQRDDAEKVFMQNVAEWYDALANPKPTLAEFRKGVIIRCKRHLAVTTSRPQFKVCRIQGVHRMFRF